MRTFKILASAALLAAGITASVANAATLFSFNFNNGVGSSTAYGNSRTFTATTGSQTLNLRASAFSINGSTLETARISVFSDGLGVINRGEGGGENNSHTIDNLGRRDFIVLQFDRMVALSSAEFNQFAQNGVRDSDATLGVGSTATPWNNSISIANMTSLNTLFPTANRQSSNSTGNVATGTVRPVNTSGVTGNIWMIAASLNNSDGVTDSFKFDDLTVQFVEDVPEPETWAMMIAGFAFVGGAMRRKRRVQGVAAG